MRQFSNFRVGLLVFCILSAVVCEAAPPKACFIVKDGEALGKVYLPANSGRAAIFAAKELKRHLDAMTGCDLKTAWRGITPRDSGFSFVVRPKSEWAGKENSQEFTIIQRIRPRIVVEISGNSDLAVLYGVYQYLENLGVRWLAPGDIGTNLPRMSNIPLDLGSKHYRPSFISRTLALSSVARNHFGGCLDMRKATYEYELFLLRNRTQFGRNIAGKSFSFNKCLTGTGHAVKPMTGLTRAAVKNGLMKKEPERFALVTGEDFKKKRKYEGAQICFTNEKNIQTAIGNCVKFFDRMKKKGESEGWAVFSDYTIPMGLSDASGICECPKCAKIAGAGPHSKDRLVWSFWNKVARGLRKLRPEAKMAVFSPYMDLTCPPEDVKVESNIMVVTPLVHPWEKATVTKADYPFPAKYVGEMKRLKESGAVLGCYTYSDFPWSPTPLLVLDDAAKFAELGFKHYHMEAMQRTEYVWPIIWALAQFTWNDKTSPQDYFNEFCVDYYGETFGPKIRWIFEEMTRNALKMDRLIFGSTSDTSYMFPDAFIAKARGILRSAVRGEQGKERERIRRLSIALETQFQVAQVYRAYARALNLRDDKSISKFKKAANKLLLYWEKNKISEINSTSRTPLAAVRTMLKTDFKNLIPTARKNLVGKSSKDELWLKEVFAGAAPPAKFAKIFPLPAVWDFHIDDTGKGFEDKAYLKGDVSDVKGWQKLSTWNWAESQGLKLIDGYFVYRLKFKAPEFPKNKKVYLRIGSLDDAGDVYLNGVKVGSQPSPFNWDKSFEMDVTKALKQGAENTLVVVGYDGGGGLGIWRPSAIYTK